MINTGYSVNSIDELQLINTDNFKDGTVIYVTNKSNWYLWDKISSTWLSSVNDKIQSLTKLTETFLQQYPVANDIFGIVTYTDHTGDNNPPEFQLQERLLETQLPITFINKVNNQQLAIDSVISSIYAVEVKASLLENQITQLIQLLGGNDTMQITTTIPTGSAPINGQLQLVLLTNPDRQLIYISNNSQWQLLSGGDIIGNSNPNDTGFAPDFIGQKWLDTSNNNLWVAIHAIGQGSTKAWASVALTVENSGIVVTG